LATGYAQIISMTNFFIRFVWMYMAQWIGFTSVTLEIEFIKNSVFYLYFLNSGLLYILAPWDSRELDLPIIRSLFQGVYTDYNANWFQDIGLTIAATAFFNLYYPVIEFFGFWGIRHVYRMIDQRSIWPLMPMKNSANKSSTVAKTIQAFESVYNGPIFLIHYKYSFILNVSFVAFLYGPGMPFLFPMAFLALFGLYTVERLMIVYVYQKPPMYDSTINQNTLYLLSLAPVLYAASAAWTYSNQQVFHNRVPINKDDEHLYELSGHTFSQFLT